MGEAISLSSNIIGLPLPLLTRLEGPKVNHNFDICPGPRINFVFLKWGNKYDCNYVNKLHFGLEHAIRRMKLILTDLECRYVCITENPAGIHHDIESW